MMKEKLTRVLKAGWTNFKRNSYVSFGTTGVMALVLLLFLGLIALNFLSATIVSTLQNKVDVSVYFKTQASEEEIGAVREDLEGLGTIRYVEYVSREQALEDFKNRHAGDPLIQESLAQLDDNPLQASLNIKANDSSQYASVVTFLEGNKFRTLIDKINFYENEQVIKRVEGISTGLQNWGFVSTLILSLIAVLVTFNTIRLTIYNQKNEIEIMRLVGGSNWYIKGPYLIEGAIYGIFAAVIALVVSYPIVRVASPKVAVLMPGVSLMSYFVANAWQFALIIFTVGILLGVTSSFVAIRRFLKV
jgi:cell division transport system permease protein